VNAVGYVNTQLVPGFNLISNPLRNTEPNGNQVQNLFASLPGGTAVYLWKSTGGFDIADKDPDFGWGPANLASREVLPGGGVFVRIPGTTPQTVTFVGEVPQGTLNTAIPAGFSIVSSQVPQEGRVDAAPPAGLGYTPAAGDALYFWNEATQKYSIHAWDSDFGIWDTNPPNLGVGEAFFARKTTAGTWSRTFNVNQ
jgi:hypothetical protein